MKIELRESDIKTLELIKGKYSYTIKTMNGNDIKGSNIDSIEAVIKHAENQLMMLNKQMLKR